MTVKRTQLNINVDPEFLKLIKIHSTLENKTLSEFIIQALENHLSRNNLTGENNFEKRLKIIEQKLGI